MITLQTLEKRFLAHVRGSSIFPREWCAQGLVNSDIGLSIYANAYGSRLSEALEADHPVLGQYLGDSLWAEFCKGYIEAHPSQVRSLRHFGAQVPTWLANHSPFSGHPVISELARFERSLLDAFDAADGERLDWSHLQALAPGAWPSLRLQFHPSVRLLQTATNAVEIWRALKEDLPAPSASISSEAARLIWRDSDRISRFRPVVANEYLALCGMFSEGEMFASLCEQLATVLAVEVVPATAISFLRQWFDDGIISRLYDADGNP